MANLITNDRLSIRAKQVFKVLELEEHTLYKVNVKITKANILHTAFLFTGFNTGGYCVIFTNTYSRTYPLDGVHFIEIVEKLTTTK